MWFHAKSRWIFHKWRLEHHSMPEISILPRMGLVKLPEQLWGSTAQPKFAFDGEWWCNAHVIWRKPCRDPVVQRLAVILNLSVSHQSGSSFAKRYVVWSNVLRLIQTDPKGGSWNWLCAYLSYVSIYQNIYHIYIYIYCMMFTYLSFSICFNHV